MVVKGYDFGRVGGNDGERSLLRRGGVSPNDVPEIKLKVVCARHGLRAPCQRVMIEFGADWGTWERLPRACFASCTPFGLKRQGHTPFDHFPNKYRQLFV